MHCFGSELFLLKIIKAQETQRDFTSPLTAEKNSDGVGAAQEETTRNKFLYQED